MRIEKIKNAERKLNMKTLEELAAIRNKMKGDVTIRNEGKDKIRIVVGMATCGIAAGARPVMKTLMEEIEKRQIKNAYVTQTGCIGVCKLEPIVEVYMPNDEKITYVEMTADKAVKIVNDTVVNGKVVTEYTIGANDK